MSDVRTELRRALAPLDGPLRYAQRTDQTLLAVRGLGEMVGRAIANARPVAVEDADRARLERIAAVAISFDAQGLTQRRASLASIVAELRLIDGPAAPAADAPEKPVRKRVAAEPVPTPVAVEGDSLIRAISSLKGIGPSIAQKLAARGLHTFGDVLLYFPRTYQDRRHQTPISAARDGEHTLLKARIVAFHEKIVGRRGYELEVEDGTGTLTARWFGFRPGAFRGFVPGAPITLSGQVREGYRGRLEMVHPDIELGNRQDDDASFGRIIPVYPEIEGLSRRAFRRIVHQVVTTCSSHIRDFLPTDLRESHHLCDLPSAISTVHFPPDDADIGRLVGFSAPAQHRLVFDELFFVQLGLALKKRGAKLEQGHAITIDDAVRQRAIDRLPFKLTGAQTRALAEISRDLVRPTPMNRLLQGDVGSGKTAVALSAALMAAENGYQTAVMAPTELLAEQHLRTFERILGAGLFDRRSDRPPVRVGVLTAGRKPKELQRTRNELLSGSVSIVVGTHALIQERVEMKRLGLVIIDEQHRFGVAQRAQLMQKGVSPHVLVMTATPIPRTLAMTLYGDLDVSVIDELPPGRTPVTTRLYHGRSRRTVYDLVRQEVSDGRQAYVVLPLVEESEKLDLRAATEEAERLKKEELAELNVGLVHGRMSSEERAAAMDRFRRGEIQVLVATTVIEVGVDVPNATVMVIEHAERFGLSQLHQLRGRVGRGSNQSFCLLIVDDEKTSADAQERLAVMARTTDGFRLAEADLAIRGPGQLLGTKQSGLPDLVVADLLRDQQVLHEAREAAFSLVERDPDLTAPTHQLMAEELRRRWEGRLSLARIG